MDGFARIQEIMALRAPLQQLLIFGALCLMRIAPIIFQVPFLGGKLVPFETRMGLSIGLTILVFPYAISDVSTLSLSPLAFLVMLLKELFIGFVIGFVASLLFYAMSIGGRALDTMRGSNLAQAMVPELKTRATPLGQFNFQLLLVVFCGLNGHTYFIESVIRSFMVVPIDRFPPLTQGFFPFVDQILQYSAALFGVAFALVFPGLFAAFLVDVVFGMFNRIAPQLNAYFMALGIKSMAGIAMLMFTLTLMFGELAVQLENSLLFLQRLVGMMG